MMLLVTGGSASGKSAYAGKLAESLMVNKESCHREILYVATLADRSPEAKRRIERHKSLRDGGCYKVAECLSMEDLSKRGRRPLVRHGIHRFIQVMDMQS